MKDINMKAGWRVNHNLGLQINIKIDFITVHNLEYFNEIMMVYCSGDTHGLNEMYSCIGRDWKI